MRRLTILTTVLLACATLPLPLHGQGGAASVPASAPASAPATAPVIVLETSKGIIEFETYPDTAPRAVAHIVALVEKNFYRGLRFHRVVEDFVIQIGDATTRDFTRQQYWGSYSSGTPVGVSELAGSRKHVAGAVSLAHLGDPSTVDSQFFICLTAQPQLDGKHPVIGKVISGLDVARQIVYADRLVRASVR